MTKFSLIRELLEFLVTRRKWWLTVAVLFLLLLGSLVFLTEGSALAPFIYTIFTIIQPNRDEI